MGLIAEEARRSACKDPSAGGAEFYLTRFASLVGRHVG